MKAHPLLCLVLLVLAGCSTSNTRRDLDVTGSLPRAIGLGAFAPTCLFLCFVTADTAQGDLRDPPTEAAGVTVHGERNTERTKGAAPARKKQRPTP